VSELAGAQQSSELSGLITALSAVLAIAMGILVGTRATRVVVAARAAGGRLHRTVRLPSGWLSRR